MLQNLLATLILAALLLTALPVQAQETLSVAWASTPPWRWWQAGRAVGNEAEMVRELAQRLDLAPRFVSCAPETCLELLAQGLIDLGPSLTPDPDLERDLAFLDPALRLAAPLAFWARPGMRPLEDVRDLTGKTLAALKNDPATDRFLDEHPQAVLLLSKPADALRLVLAGKADLAMLDRDQGRWWLERMNREDRLAECPLVMENPDFVHLTLSRTSPLAARQADIEAALADMAASGELATREDAP